MPSIYFFHRSVNMKILKQSAHIFNYLCQASAELNCIFSIPVLLMLTLRLVSATTYSYFFIYSIVQSNEVVKNMNMTSLIPVFAIMILLDWTLILVILSAADTPIYQVILKNLPQLFNRSMESKVFFFFVVNTFLITALAASIARATIFFVALRIFQNFVGKTCGLFYKSYKPTT